MAMSAFALDAVSGAPEYTGKMLRTALAALLGPPPAGRPLGATSGVRPGTPTSTVSVAGSTVTIAPHAGVLDVQADATTGPYLYAVTAAETVALDAAHATYARWDRISVQLSDPAAGDGTSTPGVAIVYTPGTPAASPALPAAPARSLTLARVVVPQSGGGAASVVWLAPEIATSPTWYDTTQARDIAIPTPTTGTIAIVGSGAAMQVTVWDGAAWRQIAGAHGPWTDITLLAGFAHQGSDKFQWRKRADGDIELRWGPSNAGMSANTVHTITAADAVPRPSSPAGTSDLYRLAVSNNPSTTARLIVRANGSIQIHTATTLGTYFLTDGVRYGPL